MNEVIENIKTRRSIRVYKSEQITEEALDAIMQTTLCAPSGSNSQSWIFTVLQNASILEELNGLMREAFQTLVVDETIYRG